MSLKLLEDCLARVEAWEPAVELILSLDRNNPDNGVFCGRFCAYDATRDLLVEESFENTDIERLLVEIMAFVDRQPRRL